MFYARCCRQHRRPRCRRQWGEAWWPRRRSRRRGWFMWRLAMWATQVDRALWLAAQQPSPSPAARAVWLLRRQKRDRAADRVSGRSGPPSVTDVHTCTRNDCPRVRSCFVRVTDTLYFPCREQSPNSAEQQPLNADAASAPPQGWTGFVTRCHAQNGPRYQLSLGKLSAHQSARAAQSLIRQKVRPSPPDALKRVTAPVA